MLLLVEREEEESVAELESSEEIALVSSDEVVNVVPEEISELILLELSVSELTPVSGPGKSISR